MNGRRVVITGIGVISGLGHSIRDIEGRLRRNETSIRDVTRFDTAGMSCSIASEVRMAQDLGNRIDLPYDDCVRYAITAAEEAVRHSGLESNRLRELGTGLALGICCGSSLLEKAIIEHKFEAGNADIVQTPVYEQTDAVSRYFGLSGPVVTFNTACSASGSAIGFAAELISKGYTDVMLAGGSDVLQQCVMAGFNQVRSLSKESCTPFGERFGLSLGEGASILVLESLQNAVNRGATIYAELLGYGLSNDAYHATAPIPSGEGMRYAIEMALRDAGIKANDIGYLNAHGTGTKLNDQAELAGIRAVFGETLFPKLPISSSKGHVGHMLGAAASTELAFSLLALGEGYLPGTANTKKLRDGCSDAKILIEPEPVQQAVAFLSTNAGMGGHNSVLAARPFDTEAGLTDDAGIPAARKRIFITGIGMVDQFGADHGAQMSRINGAAAKDGSCAFHLKSYDNSLHERGSDRIAHFAIGSADLAIKDSNWRKEDSDKPIGMVFGTSFGEAEAYMEYLRTVLTGANEGSAITNFPKGALNSTAGIVSRALGLTDFSSSLSTGGNEGLYALAFAFEAINGDKGVDRCLAASAEQLSEWLDISLASKGEYPSFAEGASTIALEAIEDGKLAAADVYAEVCGFGFSFGGGTNGHQDAIQRSIAQCFDRCGITEDEIDAVFFSSVDEQGRELINELFKGKPVITLHDRHEIALSVYALQLVGYAADWLSSSGLERNPEGIQQNPEMELPQLANHIIVVGCSINGGAGAVVLKKVVQPN